MSVSGRLRKEICASACRSIQEDGKSGPDYIKKKTVNAVNPNFFSNSNPLQYM